MNDCIHVVFLIIIIALIALVLTLLILLQSGKGGGLAGIAAGGATTQILGARGAPDILEKGTWVLATAFIILCILTNMTIGTGEQVESVIQQQAQGVPTEQTVPTTTLPDAPAAPPADAQTGNEDGGNN